MVKIAALTRSSPTAFYTVIDTLDDCLRRSQSWRQVLKAVRVLHYIVLHGSDLCTTWVRKHLYVLERLKTFEYMDQDGVDHGQCVRNSASEIVDLVMHEIRLDVERWLSGVDDAQVVAQSSSSEPRRYLASPMASRLSSPIIFDSLLDIKPSMDSSVSHHSSDVALDEPAIDGQDKGNGALKDIPSEVQSSKVQATAPSPTLREDDTGLPELGASDDLVARNSAMQTTPPPSPPPKVNPLKGDATSDNIKHSQHISTSLNIDLPDEQKEPLEYRDGHRSSSSSVPTISEQALTDRLSAFFETDTDLKNPYSDTEILQVSTLLKYTTNSWNQAPRTYIVLRKIGCLNMMDELLSAGFSDHWFPVSFTSLATLEMLTPDIRSAMVRNQGLILTKSIDLEKGTDGRHHHFGKGELQVFKAIRVIGSGSYSQVDQVLSLVSYKEYARKRIRRHAFFGGDQAKAVKDFVSELTISRRLKHRHIVHLVGSYTDSTFFALLMSPVAEMDLAAYISCAGPADFPTIRTFFGCLIVALHYLHSNRIRHKDIKPQNILINAGNILFTDFGLSRDVTGADSTTWGASSLTPRYCAPEVAIYEGRSFSSDIWSLGCVFLEMVTILKGHTLNYMKDYFTMHGSGQQFVRTHPDATEKFLQELEEGGLTSDNKAIGWTREMLQTERQARPTAPMLVLAVAHPDKHGCRDNPFCGVCCSFNEEPLDSDENDDLHDQLFQ
ncbi:kinase-like domain-containing protein [Aspergillus bertholletiae]|uniref:Kinase-like domain-containing protein n=1 Tax=Aspergillus bertholletiae TaxID=1226010 RepID=A0A5N7AYI1_9EURO|nr:kinase-like domain-containing protein [Aspergillus bertholletiae]